MGLTYSTLLILTWDEAYIEMKTSDLLIMFFEFITRKVFFKRKTVAVSFVKRPYSTSDTLFPFICSTNSARTISLVHTVISLVH